jgi:hypothetical protein
MKLTLRERKISALLAEWDPEKLISEGAPADEYDNEARTVSDQVNKKSSVEEIAAILSETLQVAFRVDDEGCDKRLAKDYAPKKLIPQAKKIAKILASKIAEVEEEPEEDVLDWEATVDEPPPKQKGKIKVKLIPKKPTAFD